MAGTKTTTYGYINIPNSFFASKLSASRLIARAGVYSLSSPEREVFGIKKKQNRVQFTISSFAKRYNFSASTARRALADLKACEEIEKTDEGMYYPADKMKESYLRVEEWLFFAKFDGEHLTKSEVLVLCRILSMAGKGSTVRASYRYIARGLRLSPTLVMNACDKLECLGLIHIITRARNKYSRTTLRIEKDYLQEKKAEFGRTLREGTSGEREEYYKNIRQQAKERQRAMLHKACKADEVFKKKYNEWYDNRDEKLIPILRKRLEPLGISWESIVKPRYLCTKCKDEGVLANGTKCTCYEENMNK